MMLREVCFSGYYSIFKNRGIDDVFSEVKQMIKDLPCEKEETQAVLNKISSLPSNIQSKFNPPTNGLFVKTGKNPKYYEQVFSAKGHKSRIYSNVVSTSIENSDVISRLIEKDVLVHNKENLIICNKCKFIDAAYIVNCPTCKGENKEKDIEILPMYELPNKIRQLWQHQPGKIIEALCYHNVKEFCEEFGVYANITIHETKSRNTLTEMDVFIEKKNCVILCTTNPQGNREKISSNHLKKLGFHVIVVTTASTAGSMKCDKEFTKIKEDKEFLKKLNEYIVALK